MKFGKVLFKINAIVFSCLLSQYIYAAGYQIFEQNTSDLGRAFAGGAADAEDASIEFTNPAGMTKIKQREMSVSGVMIAAKSRFHGDSATIKSGGTASPITAFVSTENPLTTNVVPTIHYVQPLSEKFTFGFGITEPFGLSTDYDDQGMARYFATTSKITTVNFNPSLAYAFNDHWSIGAGVSAQYLTAELDRSVAMTQRTPATDLHAKNTANGWGYGVNFGLMYTYDPNTVVGFSYRSEIGQSPSGDFAVSGVGGIRDSRVNTNLKLPETYMLSVMHRFNEKWKTDATVSYTYWSRFKYLMLDYTNPLDTPIIVDENFRNSVRYSLGAAYRWNDKLILRAGTMYDNSPVDDSNRTAALPDTDRFWLSCGANYELTHDVSMDFGYAHLFLKSGKITQGTTDTQYLSAHFNDTYVNLLGVQLNWKF